MGLDLIPSMRPHDANAEEFWRLWSDWMVEAGLRPGTIAAPKVPGFFARMFGEGAEQPMSQDARAARMYEIAEPPYALVGAPIVGQDPEADAWIIENGGAAAVEKNQGYRVLELVENCDGLPVYSNASFGEVDVTSFRGAFLTDCKAFIDEFELMLAWSAMTPSELADWGKGLLHAAKRYAEDQGVGDVIGQRDPPDGDNLPVNAAHIADSCGRWALWWSSRGHGMEPDF